LRKLIDGEKSHIDCRDWLILQGLLRTRYASHLERPQFNNLVAECKEILIGMGKILESMTTEDSKQKPEVVDEPKSGPEVVAELVPPEKEIFSRPTEVEELPTETLVDLPAAYHGASSIFGSYEGLIILEIA